MKHRKLIVLALPLLALAGCCNDGPLVQSADMFVNTTVGPEYEAYVHADPGLSAEQKTDRFQNVASFRRAVAEHKAGE